MSQHPDYTIERYSHAHDAGLAVMWNASDQQWPGGFTRGVPFTAERIADWMDKQATIVRLVVCSPNGDVVGYGSLWDEPSQPGRSCYVDLLNVHPDHQARSLCRRMLTQMVDYATEHGYKRMTIGTWSANLKAVPLYKKVGFFWKPNSSVYMENYLPTLRRLPILADFFARTDWYAHRNRELLQIEDEQRHPKTGAMEVYIERWTHPDGEWIEAVIDRKAQSVTGLETCQFAAFARVAESKPGQGVNYPITWEITNKRASPLKVQLTATGDPHIEIEHTSDFILAAGETRTITANYRCASEAPLPEISLWRPQPSPQIKTLLVLDEEDLALGTGLQYAPAAAISLYPTPASLTVGLTQTVCVQVKNQLDQPMQGVLRIVTTDGLITNWQDQCHPFAAEAQGYASAALQLTSQRQGAAQLAIVATFQADDQSITTAPQFLPVLVRNLGSVVAITHHPDPAKSTIYAENDFFYLGCEQRQGRMWLKNKAGSDYQIHLAEYLGPPYDPNEFDQRDYNLSLQQEAGRILLTCSIDSRNFPGLTLIREVVITAAPMVQVRHYLQNAGTTPHTCKILTSLNLPDSFASNGQSALPLRQRLVTAMSNLLPEIEGDFPKQPEGLAEQWGAYSMGGQVHGVIWPQTVSEHEWRPWFFDLFSVQTTIPAESRVACNHLYLYCGPGDWRTVRRLWQQLVGQTTARQLSNLAMPTPAGPQQVTLSPNPALTLGDKVTVQMHADNLRKQPINGRILLSPPQGWSADQAEFAIESLQQGSALEATIALTSVKPLVGATTGQIRIETTGYDATQRFSILRLGDSEQAVQIRQETLQDHAVWQIENGRMVWTVAPNYHAGVVGWREMGRECNHLYSAFPTDGEFDWMKPWFGGLRPVVNGNEGGWPGKLHRETFAACAIDLTEQSDLPWRGVRLSTTLLGQKPLQGISVELDYLTLPDSNLLKAVIRLFNNTPVYRAAWNPSPAFLLYTQVDGDHSNTVLYGESPHVGSVQRKRTTYSNWLRVGNWAAIVNPATGRTLTVVSPSAPESIMLMDSGKNGGHLMVDRQAEIAPHGVLELVAYLALVDSLAEAQAYAGLAETNK